MPTITLPDGSTKSFPKPVTAREVAESIGSRLAQAALGARIDDVLSDLNTLIDRDAKVSLITNTPRDEKSKADMLYLMRHSAAHVMAEAIQRIVAGVQLVYGPPLETGFYYDMAVPSDRPLTSGDFEKIEAEIKKIIAEDRAFTRYEISTQEGMSKLSKEGNKYKVDNAERALKADANARLSFYATGEPGKNWEDLCRGPHVPSTGRIGAVKVMSLASSYWHGDENSDRLTRVYGVAFPSQKELDEHLNLLEEARKRDHRVIGKQLKLFHIDEAVGQGLILWTPKGAVIRKELQTFIAAELRKQGYTEVFTPHIGSLDLYKTSGHFPYYKDAQFAPIIERNTLEELCKTGCTCAELMHRVEGVSKRMADGINERTGRETIAPDRVMADDKLIEGFMLRPMNCPHHAKIFGSAHHSYRDMPVRLAEFGTVYRWEQSGELNGMTRVRGFTQDDAHLFCTEDQVAAEVLGCLSLVKIVLNTLGMTDYRVRVGLRDPDSSKFTGDPEKWDKAEAACRDAAATLGVPFTEEPGEAAFYGPKIDFVIKDVIGREWQLGTVQVDYVLPVRFDLSYIGPDNKPHRPVMVHRAPFGSMERFCGVLIEHFAGHFPTWLAPEQVRVLTVSEKSEAFATDVLHQLKAAGVRVTLDNESSKIGAKIRNAQLDKIPYMLVLGEKEAESGNVAIRHSKKGDLGVKPVAQFIEELTAEVKNRSL